MSVDVISAGLAGRGSGCSVQLLQPFAQPADYFCSCPISRSRLADQRRLASSTPRWLLSTRLSSMAFAAAAVSALRSIWLCC